MRALGRPRCSTSGRPRRRLGPVERSLALAAAAEPRRGATSSRALPLGQRDARLLGLRARRGALEATAACPACGEQAEFAVDAGALLRRTPGPPGAARGRRLRRALAAAGQPRRRRRGLGRRRATAAERVLLDALRRVDARPGRRSELPSRRARRSRERWREADPLAEVLVDVACPACATQFVADLDVGAFVWAEVQRARAAAAARGRRARARVRLDRGRGARARRAAPRGLPRARREGARVSDFLSRIAARAVGAAPVARPRLPALFEAARRRGRRARGRARTIARPRRVAGARRPAREPRRSDRAAAPRGRVAARRSRAGRTPSPRAARRRSARRPRRTTPVRRHRAAPAPARDRSTRRVACTASRRARRAERDDGAVRATPAAGRARSGRRDAASRCRAERRGRRVRERRRDEPPPCACTSAGSRCARTSSRRRRPQPRARRAAPQGLSLADYLRGSGRPR